MKVKMLVAMDRREDPFAVGDVVDVPEPLGVAYIQARYAVAVEGERHPDPNAPEPVVEAPPEPEPAQPAPQADDNLEE